MIVKNGNVGIGTTLPDSNLQVGSISTSGNRTIRITDSGYGILLSGGGGGASNYIKSLGVTIPLYFLAGNSNDANYIFSSTGNLGIGTTTPQQKVHISSGNFALTQLGSSTTGSTPATGTQKLILGGNSSNGVGNEIGWYPNNSFQGDIAQITAIATAFGSSAAGALLFRTNTDTEATPSEKMRITSAGNVGIGRTAPAERLDVNGNIQILNGGYIKGSVYTATRITVENNLALAANGGIIFYTNGSVEAARIASTGNVGIGTTTPNAKLDVSGSAIISGSITALGAGSGTVYIGGREIFGGNVSGLWMAAASAPDGFNYAMAGDWGNGDLYLNRGGNLYFYQGAATAQMTLTTAGNLALGKTSPNAKFDVSGSAIITGSLNITGSLSLNGSAVGEPFTTVTLTRQTSNYTLVLTDAGKVVEMNSGSANTLTVPPSSSVNFPSGSFIDVIQYGAGQTTFVTGSGVTIRSTNDWLKMNARYGAATLIKIGANEWYLIGNLNA